MASKRRNNNKEKGKPQPARVPESIKQIVRSVLLSKIGGVLEDSFEKDYEQLNLSRLSWQKHGYYSLVAFMRSMPDVVRVDYDEKFKLHRFFGVAAPNQYLSLSAKKAQGQDFELETDLIPNMKGMYSLCYPKGGNAPEKEEMIRRIFSKCGDVLEVGRSNRFIFVRYGSKQEAIETYKEFKNRYGMKIPEEKSETEKHLRDESKWQENPEDMPIFATPDSSHRDFGSPPRKQFAQYPDTSPVNSTQRNNDIYTSSQIIPYQEEHNEDSDEMPELEEVEEGMPELEESDPVQTALMPIVYTVPSSSVLPVPQIQNQTGTEFYVWLNNFPWGLRWKDLKDDLLEQFDCKILIKSSDREGGTTRAKIYFRDLETLLNAFTHLDEIKIYKGRRLFVAVPPHVESRLLNTLPEADQSAEQDSSQEPDENIEVPEVISQDVAVRLIEECGQPGYLEYDIEEQFQVVVTSIVNDKFLWGHILSPTFVSPREELKRIHVGLNKIPYLKPLSPEHSRCRAKFEGEFYRGWVMQELPNDYVRVLFIDYGNVEVIHKSETYTTPIGFWDLSFMAVPFYLLNESTSSLKPFDNFTACWDVNKIVKQGMEHILHVRKL